MKLKNKLKRTYYKLLDQKRQEITLLIIFIIAVAIIGATSQIEAYEYERKIYNIVATNNISNVKDNNEIIEQDKIISDRDNNFKAVKLLTSNRETEIRIREIAEERNFQWTDYLVKLAWCESRLDNSRVNDNGAFGQDRGIFQINNKYHPTITDQQATDIDFATNWTIDKINAGQQSIWACDKIIKKGLVKL